MRMTILFSRFSPRSFAGRSSSACAQTNGPFTGTNPQRAANSARRETDESLRK